MTYEVEVCEEIRYRIKHIVEADSKEDARDIILNDINEGDIIDQDTTYFDITDIHEIKNELE